MNNKGQGGPKGVDIAGETLSEILILSRKNTNKQRKDGFRDADRGKISELLIPVFLENFEPIEGRSVRSENAIHRKGRVLLLFLLVHARFTRKTNGFGSG